MSDISFMQLQHSRTMSLLNTSSTDSSDDLLTQVIENSRSEYEATLEKYGVSTSSSSSNSAYQKVETSSETLLDVMEELENEDLYSVADDATEEYDNSSMIKTVSNFVSAYNNTVTNLNSLGGSLQSQFLPDILSTYSDNEEALEAIGITQNSDGTLSIDQDTLAAADPEDVESILGADSTYMTSLKSTLGDMNEIVATALSYSTTSSSYTSTGSLTSSLLSSFNSVG